MQLKLGRNKRRDTGNAERRREFRLGYDHRTVGCQCPVALGASLRPLQCYRSTSSQAEKIFKTTFSAGSSFLCPTFPCRNRWLAGSAGRLGRGIMAEESAVALPPYVSCCVSPPDVNRIGSAKGGTPSVKIPAANDCCQRWHG